MTQSNGKLDDLVLPLRSEASQTFMRVVAENLKADGVSTVLQAMVDEADKVCAKYDADGQKQAGGTIKKSYYKFISLLANEAVRQGFVEIPFSMNRRVIGSADPAREEPPPSPLPEDEYEAALFKEIGARTPASSPKGEPVTFNQTEMDEIERQLQMELEIKRYREKHSQFAETAAAFKLETLKAITKPGDFFRQLPTVHKLPDPPNCASGHFPDNTIVLLPSVTFQYQDKVVTRNCAVNNRTVKVGHPLGFRMPDGSHLIRSHKAEPGKEERWVKAIKYQNGALIRYFTHIDDSDAANMRWYGVLRAGEVVQISENEYRGLELALKD